MKTGKSVGAYETFHAVLEALQCHEERERKRVKSVSDLGEGMRCDVGELWADTRRLCEIGEHTIWAKLAA